MTCCFQRFHTLDQGEANEWMKKVIVWRGGEGKSVVEGDGEGAEGMSRRVDFISSNSGWEKRFVREKTMLLVG